MIGLVPAAGNIDADAARELWKRMIAVDQSLAALGNADFIQGWRDCLTRLAGVETTHPLIAGYASRLLYDAKALDFGALATSLSQALSLGNQPEVGASWVEGLLSGSGTLLIHDDRLRAVLDAWLRAVAEEHFLRVLPLLRRTFANFPHGERRVLGQLLRSKTETTTGSVATVVGDFDAAAASALVPLLTLIWGEDSPE
jgi:hypothetical protein